jgi:hypothetical protein
MAFQSDGIPRRISNHGGNRTDYDLKSNADHTRGLKTASVLYQSVTGGGLLLLAGILMYSRMSTNLALPDFVLINAVAVAAYALSHVFAYHYWKKSQSAEAEDAAQE